MISDGFVWDANRMVAELRLLRASDFERYKKVRNLLQKPENSEHFGGPEETRTLDLSDANRTLYQVVKNYAPKITTVRTLISSQNLRKTRIVAYALAI